MARLRLQHLGAGAYRDAFGKDADTKLETADTALQDTHVLLDALFKYSYSAEDGRKLCEVRDRIVAVIDWRWPEAMVNK